MAMFQSVQRSIIYFVLVTAGLFTSGCATQQYHDWYEGEPGDGAVLKSYKTVLVEAINGRDAGSAFIGQEHSYELPAGKLTLLVSYADMYDQTADDFEKVSSSPVKIQFLAEAGKTYQLAHDPIENIQAAKAFAKKPEISVIDVAANQPVETTVEYTVPKRLLPSLRFASEEEKVFASDYQTPTAVTEPSAAKPQLAEKKDLSVLKMLQFSWEQASEEERDLFLQWIKQP